MDKQKKDEQAFEMEVLSDDSLDEVSGGTINFKIFEKKIDKEGHIVHGKYDQYIHND